MKAIHKTLFLLFFLVSISAAFGQNPLTQNNLSNIKSEQITDQQLIEFVDKAKTSGMNEDQIITLAVNRGMPDAEVSLLKERITKLNVTSTTAAKIVNPSLETKPVLTSTSAKEAITVNTSAGETEIYGHQFFRNNSFQTFEKGSDAKAPEDYIIGSGDEFAISVFGYSFYNEVVKVDLNGFIKLTNIGSIYVKGITYVKAKTLIKAKLASSFDMANNQLSITLSYSRIITINIVGEVDKPGSYKMPAINTAFNALIAVGGPSNLGTVRNIQIKRNGKLIKTLDIYEFLANPNSKQEYFLEDNDFILIPPAQKIVKISGEVKRPMKYELLPKENLNELISHAGGLTSRAYLKLFSVNRLSDDGNEQKFLNLSLDSLIKNKKTFVVKDGDEISISGKSSELSQFVEIQGAVFRPGKYELIEGEKLSDLIKKANGLRLEAKKDKAFLQRLLPDLTRDYISLDLNDILDSKSGSSNDLVLKKGDILTISSNADFTQSMKVSSVGLFRKPGEYEFHKGMTLGDLLFLSGGLTIEADVLHLEISRISFFTNEYKPGESSRVIIKILEVGKDSKFTDEQLKYELSPYDEVFARITPDFEYQKRITLIGEVKYPGEYALNSKEVHLTDIIVRAGGLNKFAFAEGATLYRKDLPGQFVVMNLKSAMKNPNSKYNYILQQGDVISIPKTLDLVAIRGSVQYLEMVDLGQLNVPYVKGKRANYYINEYSNGFGEKSWKRKTYVIDHNYKVNRTKNYLLFNIYPKVMKGSTVYVIDKPIKKREKKNSQPIDWNKSIGDFTVKLTGLATLYILMRAAGFKL